MGVVPCGGLGVYSSGAVARTRDPAHAAYRDAAFIYMHIAHDYLVEPTRGELVWTRGTDTRLLRWLLGYVSGQGDGTVTWSHKAECFAWVTAVSAYALTIGNIRIRDTKAGGDAVGLDSRQKSAARAEPQPANDHTTENVPSLDLTRCPSPKRTAKLPTRQREAKRPVEAKTPALQELSHWVDDLVHDWRRSPRMMEWDKSGEFADKIEWLGTDKGLTLLEAICRESEDDGGLGDGAC
ncbi:hypothetical protein QBC37DRAFT_403196 [Rhypophila decipiens]|uniref:Uncharacterized protein n=1 Tax=Rhypophila decipiens TaxID=261697 RepID=A0AAN6Y1W9_9PEZI|nr:hypothetical protein QBC37DRAFT_403196 [Rhypophila decipiens]